jgi:hypothetical protein
MDKFMLSHDAHEYNKTGFILKQELGLWQLIVFHKLQNISQQMLI